MRVLRNIGLLATCRDDGGQGAVHAIERAALAWEGDRIAWVGREADLPRPPRDVESEDAGGKLVIPGLVDCHTHLAFGGWRADEFVRRCLGESYSEIARGGGGIARTVAQTRAAAFGDLVAGARRRLREMAKLGVTTVECKSGYGLTLEDELKLLRVYRALAEEGPQRIVATLLGAHALPPEHRDRRSDYVRHVCEEMIPAVADERLAEFCDVFVEDGAFTIDEARAVLEAGKARGLRPKIHADQLTSGGGAELAAEVGAISADHLERIGQAGIEAMARAGVVAVSLPLASFYLNQPTMLARRLIEAGVPVAVATDFNPGSAPSYHLPLAMTMACVRQGMTPAEALKGATIFAARAIGLESEVGSLAIGKRADFVLLDAPTVEGWLYHFRPNAANKVWISGKPIDD
jgi:imidazolonepropionase